MFSSIVAFLNRVASVPRAHWGSPLALAILVAALAGLGGSWGVALGQTVPPPVGPGGVSAIVGSGGGVETSNDGRTQVNVPAGSLPAERIVVVDPVPPESAPPPPADMGAGTVAFDLRVTDPTTGQPQTVFVPPITITYRPTPEEIAAVGSDLSLINLAYWNGTEWVAVQGVVNPDGSITYTIAHTTLFRVILVNKEARVAQVLDVPGGQFFTATNGFGGAGGTGFAVTDDDSAAFFTEFQRLGGENRVGLPVGGRFFFKGFITQPFQKLALQWRPELQQAVPVNVFDELNQMGVDGYLDAKYQIPPAADTSPDTGLPFEQVVSRHVGFLDPYPALKDAYLSDPNWLETFGLPLSVKDYGPFVTARLQRATMQLWKVDMPWAAAGTVVIGNGADVAKEMGLWPIDGVTPRKP